MDTATILEDLKQKAEKNSVIRPGFDYQQDGLWYCGSCHTQKQCRINWPGIPRPVTVFCMCECEDAKYKAKRDRKRVDVLGLDSPEMTLENDDRKNKSLSELARRYVSEWDTHKDGGRYGVIFWGDVGTGKTFLATAIAEALYRRGVSVARVTAAGIVEAVQAGYEQSEHERYLSRLARFELLVLDDVGAERDTSFSREVIFSVVDTRIKKQRPMIVTTNLSPAEMADPRNRKGEKDLAYKRIWDRILGTCTPLQCTGESRRKNSGKAAAEVFRA